MSSNFTHLFLASTVNAQVGTSFEIGRPYLALIMIPALLLAIIPFFRLHKSRRYTMKHMVPLFLHLVILAIATVLITDIHIVETTTAPEETQIVIVADMSDSNSAMKGQMNEYIQGVYNTANENTEVAVVVFADDSVYLHEFGDEADDYLKVSENDVKAGNTDIQGALEYAETLFEQIKPVNKRVLLMSDGRQTVGNAWSAAKKLSMGNIRLDSVYFDVTADPEAAEVQLLSIKASEIDERNANVSVTISVKATKATSGKVVLYEVPQAGSEDDEDVEVYSENVSLKEGGNSFSFEYMADGAGIHSVYATIEVDDDTVEQNNTLYSWFKVQSNGTLLLVDGDGKQVASKITSLIEDEYEYDVIKTRDFPTSMEKLLKYDEVVLMNIDFEDMPTGSTDLIKRYVEEIGRGLVFTCGSNSYKNNALADNPLVDILPVDLKIDERRETIATVITVDLSGSMGAEVKGQTNKYGEKMTRYDMVLESVLKLLDTDEFTPEDYVGVIVFDADATVALPITQLSEKEYMKQYLQESFEEYYYAHTLSEGEKPGRENRVTGTPGSSQHDANGYKVKAAGTNYGLAITKANLLLDESDADLKQMVFLSDGEPQDKGSGYDSIIRRMANSGILTSTIGIGNLKTSEIEELSLLATIGHGKFTKVTSSLDLTQSLLQIAETVKGDYKNERPTKLEKRNDSKVLVGLKTEDLDTIGGYYGTTIKSGAKMILSADDLRPIIAEAEVGNGHTTVYMSDLGGVWSNSLFSSGDKNPDNKVIVSNLLVNSLNTEIDATGLKISSERVEGVTRLTVETLKRIRDNEQLVAYVTDTNDNTVEYTEFVRVADTKYRKEIETSDEAGTYLIEVRLVTKDETPQLFDKANYAVVGFYPDEYDLFSVDGKSVMEDLSAAGDGKIMKDVKGFFDIAKDELFQFEHNISTPAIIALLLLFIIDLFFRNFSPKKEKKKKVMTDEEQYASMRGR